jgi:hypothetical protein
MCMSEQKSPEMQRFEDALRSVLSVFKSDMQKMLADEKAANAGKSKRGLSHSGTGRRTFAVVF